MQRQGYINWKEDKGMFKICDVSGKLLIQTEIGEDNNSIDISGLPAGIYILKMSKDETFQIQKIIKK